MIYESDKLNGMKINKSVKKDQPILKEELNWYEDSRMYNC
jgi:hypothetical protein